MCSSIFKGLFVINCLSFSNSINFQYRSGALGESALQCAFGNAASARPKVGSNEDGSPCKFAISLLKPESNSTPAHTNKILRSKEDNPRVSTSMSSAESKGRSPAGLF